MVKAAKNPGLEDAKAIDVGENYVVRLRHKNGHVEIYVHRIERRPDGAVEILPNGYVLGSNTLKWKI